MLKSLPLSLCLAAVAAFAAADAEAQSFKEDSLAVRIQLVRNGQSNIQVSQVATVAAGRITKLDLHGLSIDTLTAELGSLDKLQSLNLADNLLENPPAAVWNLPALVTLNLSGNGLKALDAGVANLHNLVFLDLRTNEIAALPARFTGLENLETLLLDDNLLTALPVAIGDLIFLKELDVSGNNLASVPPSLGYMSELDTLDLANNEIADLPDDITLMRASSKVALTGNKLCSLTPKLTAWANGKDPVWHASQVCSPGAVRPSAAAPRSVFRAVASPSGIRLEIRMPGETGSLRIALFDGTGRSLARVTAAASGDGRGFSLVDLEAPDAGGKGPSRLLWAEVRAASGSRMVTPVLLR